MSQEFIGIGAQFDGVPVTGPATISDDDLVGNVEVYILSNAD
jgi:hypothetical protein